MEKSISPVKQIDEEAECTDINEEDFVHDYNQNSIFNERMFVRNNIWMI